MLAWEKLYSEGINIKDLTPDSQEYDAMQIAANSYVASAEYGMAVWYLLKNREVTARTWMKRAASREFQPAIEAYEKMEKGESLEDISTFCCAELQKDNTNHNQSNDDLNKGKTVMEEDKNQNNDAGGLVLKTHDFELAKNTLRQFTERFNKQIELSRVPTDGGLFNLGNHKVTGGELNGITSQIQSYLISINELSQGIIDEFGEVYKAFEALDKDYIGGILLAIKAAEEVSIKEREDRTKIKKNQERLEKAVAALSLFKEKIDRLEHLTDIDKAWALIEKQSTALGECREYITALSKMEHIKDVDLLWNNLEKHSQALSEFKSFLQNLQNAQQQFITNAKQLIAEEQNDLTKRMESFSQAQFEKLNEIDRHYIEAFEQLRNEQKQIVKSISTSLNEKIDAALTKQGTTLSRIEQTQKEEFHKLFDGQAAQAEKIQDIEKHYSEAVEQLNKDQMVALATIDKSLSDELDAVVSKQDETLGRIEQTQKEEFKKLFDEQTSQTKKIEDIGRHYSEAVDSLKNEQNEKLDEIERSQIAKLEEINKSLEEEKAQLNEKVSTLTTKVKYLYYVAGGAASITIIQLILNIFGVI